MNNNNKLNKKSNINKNSSINKKSKNAFVIIHFGNNPKYLELEVYFLEMLKLNTKHDIIYMYSITDTPKEYVKIIESIFIKTIPYDDNNITFNIKNFSSTYMSFNTLRTCNFLFAYKLIEYDKICIVESDMVISQNIDSIFDLKSPAILYYNKIISQQNKNELIKINKEEIIHDCNDKSNFNGGVLLFKPSIEMYNKFIINIKLVIKNNCKYPNETLFAYTLEYIYNLPIKYNFSHYFLNYNKYKLDNVYIYHFNSTTYKPLDIIKDNYIDKEKNYKKKLIVEYFKKNIYDKNYKNINKLMTKYLV